ncbi:MAG: type II toxin-antitoxin system VapC family toxin [Taibaiella sp.]|nr:type II toxin-antitoxin system VapC family toxin [Taibaiella sp.]
MSELLSIKDFRPSSSESFFFDNNVWMFIHYPIGNYASEKQKAYSRLLETLILMRCNIFINALLLSEFINSCLRIEFNEWCRQDKNQGKQLIFKEHFVGCDDYKKAVSSILSSVAQIRKISQAGNDDFNSMNLDSVLAGMTRRDFNDNYYLSLAERKRWTIVSDDSDFLKGNDYKVRVVTARKL